MSRIRIVMNPSARSSHAAALCRRIETLDSEAEIVYTTGRGDAERLAREAVGEGIEVVVAAGGDGTIHEVVNGLHGTNTFLGILPIGTANVFARELKIPDNLELAWKRIQERQFKQVNVPLLNGRCFIQMAGIGVDARCVQETPWNSKRKLGPLCYVSTMVRIGFEEQPRLHIRVDGQSCGDAALVLLGNGECYGGPFKMFPAARVDDGLISVCTFDRADPYLLPWYLLNSLWRGHVNLPGVNLYQGKKVEVESTSNVPIHADGEFSGFTPVVAEMTASQLRVIVG